MDKNIRQLIGASQVAEILGISNSYAYKIIEELNLELEKAGYLTIRGKVDSLYLERRYFPAPDKIYTANS